MMVDSLRTLKLIKGASLFVHDYHWLPLATIEWVIIGNLKFEAYFEVLYPFWVYYELLYPFHVVDFYSAF